MIEIIYGRYVNTLEVVTRNGITKNVFQAITHDKKQLELTEAIRSSETWLADHFGFVVLYHNSRVLKEKNNFKLFEKTFKDMNILIELRNGVAE